MLGDRRRRAVLHKRDSDAKWDHEPAEQLPSAFDGILLQLPVLQRRDLRGRSSGAAWGKPAGLPARNVDVRSSLVTRALA